MFKSETTYFLNCFSESDYEAAENEYVLREVRENNMLYPIIREELQLCNMPKDKLSLLRMATLKDICKEYGINVSGRRKEP